MNLVVLCSGCGAIYRVLADPSEDVDGLVGTRSAFWPDSYVCPRCGGQAAGSNEESLPRSIQTVKIVDLRASELYAAQHGLGLPEDAKPTLANVRQLFESVGVRVVGTDVPNTERCSVDSLVFKDGTTLFLGASQHGAVAYRLASRHSYTAKLLEDE